MRQLDLQAHRGARGLLPENTLPAFARALSIGVTTLELDCAITRDGVVVVSHDSTLNPDITRDASGAWITRKDLPIAQFTCDELQRFDIGRIDPACAYAKRFPQQQPIDGTRMPRLAEGFALARRAGNNTLYFNIETKISPLHPERTVGPEAFARALIAVVHANQLESRTIIQSFDWRTLAVVQREAPRIATSYLSVQQAFEDTILARQNASPWNAGLHVNQFNGSVPRMIHAAGGAIWSPNLNDIDAAVINEAHALGIKVIVWTVNTEADMQHMMALNVDGIISDYPDLLRRVAREQGYLLPAPTPVTTKS